MPRLLRRWWFWTLLLAPLIIIVLTVMMRARDTAFEVYRQIETGMTKEQVQAVLGEKLDDATVNKEMPPGVPIHVEAAQGWSTPRHKRTEDCFWRVADKLMCVRFDMQNKVVDKMLLRQDTFLEKIRKWVGL